MDQNDSHDPATTDRDERRWDRWGWITLVIGVLLIVWPIFLTFYSFRYPSDGWDSSSTADFGVGGRYRISDPFLNQVTPLREDDIVVAIDDRPLLPDTPPPFPGDLEVGQVVRYTLDRAGQTVEADVTLVRLPAATLLANQLALFRENPGNTLFTYMMMLLAAIVFLLRPGSLAARYLFLFAAFQLGIGVQIYQDLYAFTRPPWLSFLAALYGWGWVYIFMPCLTLLALVFPVRKWPARRFPRLLPLLLIGLPLVGAILANILVWFVGYLPAGRLLWPLTLFSASGGLIVLPIALVHNLLTIREPLPRMQMRWLALGFGLGFVLPMIVLLISFYVYPIFDPRRDRLIVIGNLAMIILPLCLAIGILHYRLFDIDVIIRRTTSYALVTGLLALIYFGSIVVLQGLLSPFMSDATPAVVLSTLLIAALFLPVRRRVQDAIDRRFNRRRYDAEKTLAAFAAAARDETDLDALLAELVRVIQATMEPEQVSVWLRPTDSPRPPGEG